MHRSSTRAPKLSKPKRPKFVTPRVRAEVQWRCVQVTGSLAPEEVRHGMRVGFCEHAMNSRRGSAVPTRSRFVLGTVSLHGSPSDPLMTITFDAHPEGVASVTCGRNEYARFCIPVEVGR